MTDTPGFDAIKDALAQASAAAAAMTSQGGAAASSPSPTNQAVAPVTQGRPTPGKPISMAEMMANKGSTVDLWLKVGYHGITVGKEKDLITKIEGIIDVKAVKPFFGVRYGGTGNTIYNHTFDGVTAAKGTKPWAEVMAEAYRVMANDPNFKGEYTGVEVVIIPEADVLSQDGKKVLAKQGKKLGFSTSVMNFRDWQEFYDKCVERGLTESKVRVELGYESSDYKGKWGKFIFGEPVELVAA
jgi:hypothetical protein